MKLQKLTSAELPESEYHGEQYKDFLSGSELWEYLSKCPAEAVYGEKKESASLITGSAAHSEVLEMHSFDELYYRGYEPTENCLTSDAAIRTYLREKGRTGFSNKTGDVLWDAVKQIDPGQHCLREQEKIYADKNEGKQLLPFSVYDDCKAMREQLMQYEKYSYAVLNGDCEHSIVGKSSVFGVDVKIRPDIILPNNFGIVNYKTSTDSSPEKAIRDAFNYGYMMKEVFNLVIFMEYVGLISSMSEFESMIGDEDDEAFSSCFVALLVQSKKKPYVCSGIPLTNTQVKIGVTQLQEAFSLWSACKESGQVIDHCQGEWVSQPTPQWMISKVVN